MPGQTVELPALAGEDDVPTEINGSFGSLHQQEVEWIATLQIHDIGAPVTPV